MPAINALPVPADQQVNHDSYAMQQLPKFMAWAEIRFYARSPHFGYWDPLRLSLTNSTDFWKIFYSARSIEQLNYYAEMFGRAYYFYVVNSQKYSIPELKQSNTVLGGEAHPLINYFGFVRSKQVGRQNFWELEPNKLDPIPQFNDYWAAVWHLGSAFEEEGTLGKDFDFASSAFCSRSVVLAFIRASLGYARNAAAFIDLMDGITQEILSEVHVTAITRDFMIRFIEARPSILDAALKCLKIGDSPNKINYLATTVFSYSNILAHSNGRLPPSYILKGIYFPKLDSVSVYPLAGK